MKFKRHRLTALICPPNVTYYIILSVGYFSDCYRAQRPPPTDTLVTEIITIAAPVYGS